MAHSATKSSGKKQDPSQPIALRYTLGELPSSQHRAGLAGLVLMVRWLHRHEVADDVVCEVTELTAQAVTLRLNETGLVRLFDHVYGATTEEQSYTQPFKNKEPLREVETVELDAKGKARTKKSYVYPRVVPKGAFVADWETATEPLWTKLWRDMVWTILRGVPATRTPFEARASGGPYKKDASDVWATLCRGADASVELPSTYFLGAQAATADNVAFRDRHRFLFLLHFWPFLAQIYVPRITEFDGTTKFANNSYAIAIPDVADVAMFCDVLPDDQRSRSATKAGYRPAGSIVDIAIEGAFDLMARIGARVAQKQGALTVSGLLLGVDVVYTEKQGNNVRVLSTTRVDPNTEQLAEFTRLQRVYWSSVFRKQRFENLWLGRPWFSGFGRLLSIRPRSSSIDSKDFKHDAREAFKNTENVVPEVESSDEESTAQPIEALVYRAITRYVFGKLKTKHGLEWSAIKDDSARERYGHEREKIAKDAFLAVRSRTGTDFVHYFANTLCSVPQRLDENAYTQLTRALLDDTETVRTLTLLALSARG